MTISLIYRILVGKGHGKIYTFTALNRVYKKNVIKEIKRKTRGLPRPRVYVETGFDPLFTCGKGSFIHDLIEIAGGNNIAGEKQKAIYSYRRGNKEKGRGRDHSGQK